MHQLEYLCLASNQLTALNENFMENCHNLVYLNLRGNLIERVNWYNLSKLRNLSHLNLSDNKIYCLPSNLAFFQDEFAMFLSQNPRLTFLSLNNLKNSLGDPGGGPFEHFELNNIEKLPQKLSPTAKFVLADNAEIPFKMDDDQIGRIAIRDNKSGGILTEIRVAEMASLKRKCLDAVYKMIFKYEFKKRGKYETISRREKRAKIPQNLIALPAKLMQEIEDLKVGFCKWDDCDEVFSQDGILLFVPMKYTMRGFEEDHVYVPIGFPFCSNKCAKQFVIVHTSEYCQIEDIKFHIRL